MNESNSPILALATEVLVAIFLELGEPELGDCRLVCRSFRSVLDIPIIQYKRRLIYAGMVDVPPIAQGPTLSARSDALATYMRCWREAELSFDKRLTEMLKNSYQMVCAQTVMRCYDRSIHSHRFFLPPSTIRRRLEAQEWAEVEEKRDGSYPKLWLKSCATDYTQGVIVFVDHDEGNIVTCLFRSISDSGLPHLHPSGTIATFSTVERVKYFRGVQLCGSILVTSLSGYEGRTTVNIYNWKTGLIQAVYSFYAPNEPRQFGLMDESHIFILFDFGIQAYIVGHLQPCRTYRLPAPNIADKWHLWNIQYSLRMPFRETPSMPSSLFRSDPFSAILGVTFTYQVGSTRAESFLLLAPCFPLVCGLQSNGRNEAVVWDEWGPGGSCLFQLRAQPMSISALGSRCAVAFAPDTDTVDIFLIDVLPPGKNQASVAREDERIFARYFYPPDAMDDVKSLRGVLRTSLPFRMMYKHLYYDEQGSDPDITVNLTDDGLVIVRVSDEKKEVHSFFL